MNKQLIKKETGFNSPAIALDPESRLRYNKLIFKSFSRLFGNFPKNNGKHLLKACSWVNQGHSRDHVVWQACLTQNQVIRQGSRVFKLGMKFPLPASKPFFGIDTFESNNFFIDKNNWVDVYEIYFIKIITRVACCVQLVDAQALGDDVSIYFNNRKTKHEVIVK